MYLLLLITANTYRDVTTSTSDICHTLHNGYTARTVMIVLILLDCTNINTTYTYALTSDLVHDSSVVLLVLVSSVRK